MALLRAVDKFDAGRGYKFSTYACRAILKAFSRQGMKLSKYRQRFPTDFDPKLERSNYLETKRADFERDAAEEVKRIVLENRADLTQVERTVIEHRFGLESGNEEKPMTLEQVGQIIGVTKERVRQIRTRPWRRSALNWKPSSWHAAGRGGRGGRGRPQRSGAQAQPAAQGAGAQQRPPEEDFEQLVARTEPAEEFGDSQGPGKRRASFHARRTGPQMDADAYRGSPSGGNMDQIAKT